MRVVSLGDLVADLVVTIPQLPVEASKHQHAHSIKVEPGGAGNFLIAGARLGMQMRALGTLGRDFFGQAVADRLSAEGVDLGGVVRSAGSTTTTVIVLIDDGGGHVFLGAYGEGPLVELPAEWIDEITASQAVFAAGYTLQEKRISGATFEAMQIASQRGVPVFFDPGFEMARCSEEQKRARPGIQPGAAADRGRAAHPDRRSNRRGSGTGPIERRAGAGVPQAGSPGAAPLSAGMGP
jgi:sugar/nucleoside kinase (ribokinase family)